MWETGATVLIKLYLTPPPTLLPPRMGKKGRGPSPPDGRSRINCRPVLKN